MKSEEELEFRDEEEAVREEDKVDEEMAGGEEDQSNETEEEDLKLVLLEGKQEDEIVKEVTEKPGMTRADSVETMEKIREMGEEYDEKNVEEETDEGGEFSEMVKEYDEKNVEEETDEGG